MEKTGINISLIYLKIQKGSKMDKFYIVSLPGSVRRNKIKNRLECLGFDFDFVDAVTPDSDLVKFYGKDIDLNGSRFPESLQCTFGKEFACFASHLLCLKKIYESGKPGFVIEDDALLVKDFKNKFTVLDKNVNLIHLSPEIILNSNGPGVHKISNNWCAVGYWVNNVYAKEIYDKFNTNFINLNYNYYVSELIIMLSGGNYVIPQMIVEDPLNISTLRSSEQNLNSRYSSYKTSLSDYIDWDDFILYETESYKQLFKYVMSRLFGSMEKAPIIENLDSDQQKILELYSRFPNTYKIRLENKYLINYEIEKDEYIGKVYLSSDEYCYIDSGSNTVSYKEMCILDPMEEPFNDKNIIKKHLSIDYNNFMKNRNIDYYTLLNWYLDMYKTKNIKSININVNKLNDRQKLFYYNLVLRTQKNINYDLCMKVCKEVPKICTEDLVPVFSGLLNEYYFAKLPKLVIYGHSVLDYDPLSTKEGLYGSEESIVYLSDILKKDYDVEIVNPTYRERNRYSLPFSNPRYTCSFKSKDYDIAIHWRCINKDLLTIADKNYGWWHDIWYSVSTEDLKLLDGSFMISDYQKSQYSANVEIKNPIVCYNGIVPSQFSKPRTCTNKYSIVYTSCYNRGLINLFNMWPEIKKEYPESTLDICYGWTMWNTPENIQSKIYEAFKEASKLGGITDHGKVGHDQLISIMKNSSIWAYPCNFYETFCITAVKMQACGVVPVVVKIGALKETVQYGHSVESMSDYKDCLFDCMKNIDIWTPEKRKEMSDNTLTKWPWENVANIWKTEFLQ